MSRAIYVSRDCKSCLRLSSLHQVKVSRLFEGRGGGLCKTMVLISVDVCSMHQRNIEVVGSSNLRQSLTHFYNIVVVRFPFHGCSGDGVQHGGVAYHVSRQACLCIKQEHHQPETEHAHRSRSRTGNLRLVFMMGILHPFTHFRYFTIFSVIFFLVCSYIELVRDASICGS